MKHDPVEMIEVEFAANEAEGVLTQLGELQLALVGGGTGEVVIA
jgi:hypothetical protein